MHDTLAVLVTGSINAAMVKFMQSSLVRAAAGYCNQDGQVERGVAPIFILSLSRLYSCLCKTNLKRVDGKLFVVPKYNSAQFSIP